MIREICKMSFVYDKDLKAAIDIDHDIKIAEIKRFDDSLFFPWSYQEGKLKFEFCTRELVISKDPNKPVIGNNDTRLAGVVVVSKYIYPQASRAYKLNFGEEIPDTKVSQIRKNILEGVFVVFTAQRLENYDDFFSGFVESSESSDLLIKSIKEFYRAGVHSNG